MRQPFHKIVAISFLDAQIIKNPDGSEYYELGEVRSGCEVNSNEEELVKGFFSYLQKKLPRIVSFNGKNFDLPVLKYRAMQYKIAAPWLYLTGDKWNNYNQRYSLDWHCDLIDAFSDFGASSKVKMNEVCSILNIPGKLGIDGSKVMDYFDDGKIDEIRQYCETDVLNTYLLYLNYQHHRGILKTNDFENCQVDLKSYLENSQKDYLIEYLDSF